MMTFAKFSLKWRHLNVLTIAALSISALMVPTAQAQQNSQQTINPGDRNRIQQRVQVCGRLQRDLEALNLDIDQNRLQTATAVGERNRIQQRIQVCCGRQVDPVALAEQLENTEQTATVEGDRNRVRQRIRLCNG